ncbi:GRAVITROPIC IN THE LIGHT 1-like [Olea europaea subsp. europaea]|uniref:GRAVITROPIC IN THE LIGHT 1-like n=1 Tax=Olea europaea subsp. europaea TaxID=158383 RepID=A0A8S0P826_OLEEU|nr:GRAVITROPIC IN THE LIGHT 1-like [Olea europaea subsp. europaea]
MDSIRPCPAAAKSKIARTFQKVIHLKSATKNLSNPGFCLLIPQEKLKCSESQQVEKENLEEEAKESKNRAAVEAFVAKLFATVSAVKAAYAELQVAQFPYNNEAIRSADQAVVDELKELSELKHRFLKKQIDSSPPHVTLMLAENQEQQSLMKTYEITMKKMQREIERKDTQISLLQDQLQKIVQTNKSLEIKLNASGSFSILDNIKFSDSNPKVFIMVLHHALRSIRNFVKMLIGNMESVSWDIDAAANAIQPEITFSKRDHKGFAFESFVCREIFCGFNEPFFSIQNDHQPLPNGTDPRRIFFFEHFKNLRSVSVIQFLGQNQNSLFGKFLKSKYLRLVHPKMEFSFAGNLNQRKMVNSSEYPETEFFKAFAEMGRRVWLLHCLTFSFDQEVSIFQVKRNARFSEVYMESITDDIFVAADRDFRVAFTVVPGFKVGQSVVQSQVYLFPTTTPPRS